MLQLIGAAADMLALCTSAQGSLMEAMQRRILGHRKSPLTACLSPRRHLTPQRSNRKLLSLVVLSFLFLLGKTKRAKANHERNRTQAAVNRHQHNYEETSADRISNKRQFGFVANRNSSSSTSVHSVFFPHGPRCHQTHQNINLSRLLLLTVNSWEECEVFLFRIFTKRR